MFERELTLYKFQLGYLKMVAADLDESAMTVPPFEGANPPVWILGHLAVSMDFAARMLGQPTACPRNGTCSSGRAASRQSNRTQCRPSKS